MIRQTMIKDKPPASAAKIAYIHNIHVGISIWLRELNATGEESLYGLMRQPSSVVYIHNDNSDRESIIINLKL